MSRNRVVTSISMPPNLLADLKALARLESKRRRAPVGWSHLVREAITNQFFPDREDEPQAA
jgi:hypothetical protein